MKKTSPLKLIDKHEKFEDAGVHLAFVPRGSSE